MNNLAETEQERAYRKNKNAIVGMIMLNIFPVYAGKIHKVYEYAESWGLRSRLKGCISSNDLLAKSEFLKLFLVLRLAHAIQSLRSVPLHFQSFII